MPLTDSLFKLVSINTLAFSDKISILFSSFHKITGWFRLEGTWTCCSNSLLDIVSQSRLLKGHTQSGSDYLYECRDSIASMSNFVQVLVHSQNKYIDIDIDVLCLYVSKLSFMIFSLQSLYLVLSLVLPRSLTSCFPRIKCFYSWVRSLWAFSAIGLNFYLSHKRCSSPLINFARFTLLNSCLLCLGQIRTEHNTPAIHDIFTVV